ncbi:MAG: hypothetical protein Kow0065_15060 [Methylomicrobium sp.]
MAEILFILTTIFVAYVVYKVVGDQMEDMKAIASKAETPTQHAETPVKPKVEVVENKPARRSASQATESAQASAAESSTTERGGLRNPATGETASVPTNYRFAKRWIKEALVKEGLLDKVYKNNEIDDEANAKIKAALDQFMQLDRYRA